MQPHQQRVVDEKRELDDKLTKLIAFITSSPVFESLDLTDQGLLCDQQGAMTDYSAVLEERIARFVS
jgi:hypothetical protein